MPLRLVEVRVPPDRASRIEEILDEATVVDAWTVEEGDAGRLVHALVRSESVEALTDALSEAFEGADTFRIVLLPVEASVPRVEEPEAEGDGASEPVEEEKSRDRISREELLQELESVARLRPVYLATVFLSTVVAAVGLMRGDVAVIIGAMVIAPLLGPNMALALSATLGESDLGRRALVTSAAGAALGLAVSVAIGVVFPVDPTVAELAARTRVGLSDVALALAAGSAGALAFTTGLPTAVIGVMVAVALLPPLVAVGLLAGAGLGSQALAAATLLATNVTCVNLAAVATFLAQGVAPREWWQAKKARKTAVLAMGTWVALLLVLVLLIVFAWNG